MPDPLERVPESVSPRKGVEIEPPLSQPTSAFESYMQGTAKAPPLANAETMQGASPMELAKPANMQTGAPTMNTLLAQANNMQDSIGTVGDQLKTQNLKLKRSQAHLLKNKLQDAGGYMRSAAAKLDIEIPQAQIPSGLSPPARFLAMLGDGQDQLMAIQQKLKDLSKSEGGISPGDMMLIQVKMSQAQQEIEYSSTLLGKVIQSMTQLLQTQL
jgi:hypothetical protein